MAKKKNQPFHIANKLKQFELKDGTKFWAKNEEDAMIRTLSFVSKDGSGQREDLKRPMYNSKPMIREWIDKIIKLS